MKLVKARVTYSKTIELEELELYGVKKEKTIRRILDLLAAGKKTAMGLSKLLNLPLSTTNLITRELIEQKKAVRHGSFFTVSSGYLVKKMLDEAIATGGEDQKLRELLTPLLNRLFEIHEWPPDWMEEYARARVLGFAPREAWELAGKKFRMVETWIPSI